MATTTRWGRSPHGNTIAPPSVTIDRMNAVIRGSRSAIPMMPGTTVSRHADGSTAASVFPQLRPRAVDTKIAAQP